MFLQVMSWEERARLLSKVWIAGIILAILAVSWFLWQQRKRKKLQREKWNRRGLIPKKSVTGTMLFDWVAGKDAPEALIENFKIPSKRLEKYDVAFSQKETYYLCAFLVKQESAQKLRIKSGYLHQANDQRALHWLLRKLATSAAANQTKSFTYYVALQEKNDFPDMLESFGFKRVAVGKKQKEKFRFALKYNL
ncbi:MAG: hypothetical protein ACPF8V_10590 [Luteibaculum sp.]